MMLIISYDISYASLEIKMHKDSFIKFFGQICSMIAGVAAISIVTDILVHKTYDCIKRKKEVVNYVVS